MCLVVEAPHECEGITSDDTIMQLSMLRPPHKLDVQCSCLFEVRLAPPRKGGTSRTDWLKLSPNTDTHPRLFWRLLAAVTLQAIYACHGREAPQPDFPDRTESTNCNVSGADEPQSRGGGGGRLEPPSSAPQNGAVAEGDINRVESDVGHAVDDNQKSSQAARDLFYRRGEAGKGVAPATGNAVMVRGAGSPDDRNVDTSANNVCGTPGELELNSSVFWPDPASASTRQGVADGSAFGSEGDEISERNNFQPRLTTAVGTDSSTAESSSVPSVATSVLVGGAPKLLDFFDMQDENSSRLFRAARDYLEEFRDLNLDRAILESGLGTTGQRLAALDLPLMARYTFQVISSRALAQAPFQSLAFMISCFPSLLHPTQATRRVLRFENISHCLSPRSRPYAGCRALPSK